MHNTRPAASFPAARGCSLISMNEFSLTAMILEAFELRKSRTESAQKEPPGTFSTNDSGPMRQPQNRIAHSPRIRFGIWSCSISSSSVRKARQRSIGTHSFVETLVSLAIFDRLTVLVYYALLQTHIENVLRVATPNIDPEIEKLLSQMQFNKSH